MKRSTILSALVASACYCYLSNELSAQSESLSFRLVGKLICIEASAETRTGLFILDTGYDGVLLNRRYFTGRNSDAKLHGLNGSDVPVKFKYVDLALTHAVKRRVCAEVGDLLPLENNRGVEILGLIGGNFFEDYELTFDYASHAVTLNKLDRKGQKLTDSTPAPPPTIVLKCAFKGHLPCVEARVGDFSLRLGIDSGAESNLFATKIQNDLTSGLEEVTTVLTHFINQGPASLPMGKLTGFELGNIPYAPMKTGFSDFTQLNLALIGPKLDGILGYEFLSQYKTSINYRKKEISIWVMEKQLSQN